MTSIITVINVKSFQIYFIRFNNPTLNRNIGKSN